MATQNEHHFRRARRVRARLKAVANGRPRLSVSRSLKNISVQIIDDLKGVTLVAASTLEADFRKVGKSGGNKDAAAQIGQLIAKRAREAGVKAVVFDRGAYIFHGRVKALADAAREGGLDF